MALLIRRRIRRSGFHLLRLLAWIAGRRGLQGLRHAGEWIGSARYRLGRQQRLSLLNDLQHLYGDQLDRTTLAGHLLTAYRVSDRSLLEIVAMSQQTFPRQAIANNCRVEHLQRLSHAVEGGRGALLIGMHMGNGILMAARLAAEGFPISVVYRESNKVLPGFFDAVFANHGIEGINANQRINAYRQMTRALKAGRVVYVLLDQGTKKGGVPVQFLGKVLHVPGGPAELVRRVQPPVLAALTLAAHPRWQFEISAPLALPEGDTRAITEAMAAVMEQQIRARPELWTWHHRHWRKHPFSGQQEAD